MSAPELEVIEAVYAAWLAGELDRALEHLAPDIEWTAIESDRLALVTRVTARGLASGLEAGLQYAQVYDFANGLLHRVHEYATREEALASVGLGE